MRLRWLWLSLVLMLSGVTFADAALVGPSYRVVVDALATGGGSSSSPGYRISQLAGQSLADSSTVSASYRLQSGFYSIERLEAVLRKRATCLVQDGATLYAGFAGEGVWRSLDSGLNWTPVTTQPPNRWIKALVIHPTVATTLYVATYGGGIAISLDGGDNWISCSGQPGNLNSVTLAIDPAGTLYAGTEGGIFTSSDCTSWTAVNAGLTVDAAKPPVAINIDPVVPSTLFAGLDGVGVYKSIDSGANWTAATTQPTNLRVKALAIKDSTQLFAATYGGGVFASSDGGVNWGACATQPANLNLLSLMIDENDKLYAGSEGGVFVSSDNCGTWTAINAGLP